MLANAGPLDRGKPLAVVEQFVDLAGADEGLRKRTWVLLTAAVRGGWGLSGHYRCEGASARVEGAMFAQPGTGARSRPPRPPPRRYLQRG